VAAITFIPANWRTIVSVLVVPLDQVTTSFKVVLSVGDDTPVSTCESNLAGLEPATSGVTGRRSRSVAPVRRVPGPREHSLSSEPTVRRACLLIVGSAGPGEPSLLRRQEQLSSRFGA